MPAYIFGPVPSRRLGRSLGVDLVPFKTCTYDCIYCQLGRTTCKTTTRKEWIPLEDVLKQLQDKLTTEPNYITLSGSGEPTLFSRIGELISRIKKMTDIPVAVLTNGSLLGISEVRAALMEADLVMPSLDAGDEKMFRYVNRPVADITFDRMVEGLVTFGKEYSGRYWLEVFLLGGVTGFSAEVEKIANISQQIDPDRVQLNTVTRPPAENFAYPVSKEQMNVFATIFGDRAEVIADYRGTHQQAEFVARREDVLNLLCRRPCTTGDIAKGLGIHPNEVAKYVEQLSIEGLLGRETRNGRVYYKASRHEANQ